MLLELENKQHCPCRHDGGVSVRTPLSQNILSQIGVGGILLFLTGTTRELYASSKRLWSTGHLVFTHQSESEGFGRPFGQLCSFQQKLQQSGESHPQNPSPPDNICGLRDADHNCYRRTRGTKGGAGHASPALDCRTASVFYL